MDDAALQTHLARIESRQRLLLALFVLPYYVILGDLFGYAEGSILAVTLGAVAVALLIFRRRAARNTAGQ